MGPLDRGGTSTEWCASRPVFIEGIGMAFQELAADHATVRASTNRMVVRELIPGLPLISRPTVQVNVYSSNMSRNGPDLYGWWRFSK